MNNVIRKRLAKIQEEAGNLVSGLETFQEEVTGLGEEEREKFDNMSENLQSSENGQKFEEAADLLDEVSGELEEALQSVKDALERLGEL